MKRIRNTAWKNPGINCLRMMEEDDQPLSRGCILVWISINCPSPPARIPSFFLVLEGCLSYFAYINKNSLYIYFFGGGGQNE